MPSPPFALPAIDLEQIRLEPDASLKQQMVGNAIYLAIHPAVGDHASKVTGMLLDENAVNVDRLLHDLDYFVGLVNEAMHMLANAVEPVPSPLLSESHSAAPTD